MPGHVRLIYLQILVLGIYARKQLNGALQSSFLSRINTALQFFLLVAEMKKDIASRRIEYHLLNSNTHHYLIIFQDLHTVFCIFG